MLKYFEQEDPNKKVVILLPQFLTAIMTLRFSQYPWHIYVIKKGNVMVMNSYEDTPLTYLDLYAVNENTQNNMPDESIVQDNCKMATQVARSFRDQIASGDIVEQVEDEDAQEEEQEEQEGEKLESFKKYVKISIGDLELYTYA